MPLNFDEPLTGSKYPYDSQRPNSGTRLSHGPLPKELETEIIPILMKKVGDWKSGRISLPQVEAYLDRYSILFDRDTLRALFAEADFRKEGSIDRQGITAALTGRYASRKHNADWRTLVSLIVGVKTLTLTTDRDPDASLTQSRSRDGVGSFNSDSIWSDPVPELPPISSPLRGSSRIRVQSSRPNPLVSLHNGSMAPNSLNASLSPSKHLNNTSFSSNPDYSSPSRGNLSLPSPSTFPLPLSPLPPPAAVAGVGGGYSLTLEEAMAAAGQNQMLGTLEGARQFSAGMARHLGIPKQACQLPPTPGLDGSSLITLSPLPPSPICIPSTSLATLRSSVRSSVLARPHFQLQHRCLDSSELDLKSTMGEHVDLRRTLAREMPVRPDKVLYNADYVTWSDYSSRQCRTAPSRWYNGHPAIAPTIMASEHKYPWC